MKFALVNGEKLEATPGSKGVCPCCSADVRAYCGLVKVYHWKHISHQECDPWYEGETEWHRNWKNKFDPKCQEVIRIDHVSGERHIADVYLDQRDVVLEFQNSPIQIGEIKDREEFYKRMIWIVNVFDVKMNILLFSITSDEFWEKVNKPWVHEISFRHYPFANNPDIMIMKWKFRHRRWLETSAPLFFDIGDEYIYRKLHTVHIANVFVVKRVPKIKFIDYYNSTQL